MAEQDKNDKIFFPSFIQIPKQILESIGEKELTWLDGYVYGIVYWFARLKGEKCYLGNKVFADLLGVTGNRTISRSLARLEKQGYIKRIERVEDKRTIRDEIIPLIDYKTEKGIIGVFRDTTLVSSETHGKRELRKRERECVSKLTLASKNDLVEGMTMHKATVALFDYYKAEFFKKISSKPPIFNWAVCAKNAKPHLRNLGLKEMKVLVDKYLDYVDKDGFYRKNAWSLSCFLSTKIIHQLYHDGK